MDMSTERTPSSHDTTCHYMDTPHTTTTQNPKQSSPSTPDRSFVRLMHMDRVESGRRPVRGCRVLLTISAVPIIRHIKLFKGNMEVEFKDKMEKALFPLRKTFQICGLWPPSILYNTGVRKVLFVLLGWLNIFEYAFVTGSEFAEMVYRWPNLADITTAASTSLTGVLSSVKLLMLYLEHKNYTVTITTILRNEFALEMPLFRYAINLNLDESTEINEGDKQAGSFVKLRKYLRATLDSKLKECRIVFYMNGAFVVLTLLGYCIPPGLKTILTGKTMSEKGIMHTPFRAQMPVDQTTYPGYQITYASQLWCAFITFPGYTGADTLLSYHLILTTRQFDLIIHVLDNIEEYAAACISARHRRISKPDVFGPSNKYEDALVNNREQRGSDDNDSVDEEMDMMCVNILIQCISHYERLMSYVDSLNAVFGVVLFFQLISSSVLICLVFFKYKTEDAENKMTYLTYIGAASCQLFQYCWYSQSILNKSTEVGESVYRTNWYKFSTKYKKSAIMLIRQSQRAITITALGFTSLSLPAFTSILSTAMSYFTLLNSFLEEP